MSTPADVTAGPLAEFAALRAEIERRSAAQGHVITLQIGIAGTAFGFTLSAPHRELLLLVLPIATYMTFGRYATEATYINQLGRYFRAELTFRVPGGLHWEEWRLKNRAKSEMGIFARLHFAGVLFPGVSTLAIGAFVLLAASNHLARGQTGVTIAVVTAIVVIELVLTTVIVLTMWRLRQYALATGLSRLHPAQPGHDT